MPDALPRAEPFELPLPVKSRLVRAATAAARPFLERTLGLRELRRLYRAHDGLVGETFEARALEALDITIHAVSPDVIPATGPLIVAANHPTGALDGLAVTELVRRTRSDVRVLANRLLERIPTERLPMMQDALDKAAQQALRAGDIIRRLRDFVSRGEAERRVESIIKLVEEASALANNTPYGLSAGVWTDKGSKIFKIVSQLRAGVVWANTYNKFDPSSPFGGYKESGFGREGGRHGLLPYLNFS